MATLRQSYEVETEKLMAQKSFAQNQAFVAPLIFLVGIEGNCRDRCQ